MLPSASQLQKSKLIGVAPLEAVSHRFDFLRKIRTGTDHVALRPLANCDKLYVWNEWYQICSSVPWSCRQDPFCNAGRNCRSPVVALLIFPRPIIQCHIELQTVTAWIHSIRCYSVSICAEAKNGHRPCRTAAFSILWQTLRMERMVLNLLFSAMIM